MPWTLRTLLNITLAAAPLALYLGLRCASSAGLLNSTLTTFDCMTILLVSSVVRPITAIL